MENKVYFCTILLKRKRKSTRKMKGTWSFLLLMTLLLSVSCTHRPTTVSDASTADSSTQPDSFADSVFTAADTLPMDEAMEEVPLPATVDELFDDFIFVFDQSNHLQRQRIHFPLTVMKANGERHQVTRKEWSHRALFMGQDYCTVLWNNHRQMGLSQDSSVCSTTVEQIFLHSRVIEAYDFERDSTTGQWMLEQQRQLPFEHSDLQSFLDFYRQWATDSIFQRQHVQDPLHLILTDENEENGTIEGTIDVDQWFEFAPDLPGDVITNILYGQTYHNAQRMILQVRGFNNSLQNLLTFRRDGTGQWRLITYEN